jgi:hypothetical protein
VTKDQKHALYVAGGVAGLIALYYLWQQSQSAVIPAPSPSIASPGYTDYNVPAINANPAIPAAAYNFPGQGGIGCGCATNSDCFTSNPDSGQSPVSLEQAMKIYSIINPDFANAFAGQVSGASGFSPTTGGN